MLRELIKAILLIGMFAGVILGALKPIPREIVIDSGDGTIIIIGPDGNWVEKSE
jgi:hypothetical protein